MKLTAIFLLLKSLVDPIPRLNLDREGPIIQPRCFRTSDVSVRYIIEDFNEINENRAAGDCALEFEGTKSKFGYYMRHAWGVESCEMMVPEWQRILRGSKYICVYGTAVDVKYSNEWPKKFESWVYEKIITDRGCASYFTGDCTKGERIRVSSR